jgi:hypothetical protein
MSQLGRQTGRVLLNRYLRNAGVAVVLLMLAAQPAVAGTRQARERAARKACLSGEYAKGMD